MGKQDMCDNYARNYAESFDNTTEEDARERWDDDLWNVLTLLRTRLTESVMPIFPVKCPKCDSFKLTVVLGTARSLECLSCGSNYRIVDK